MNDNRDARQIDIAEWAAATFGAEQVSSVPQRGIRMLEEAIEAYQAAGCDRAMAHKLVDFVFDRPPGDLWQELGGLGVTTLCLAQAADMSADYAERAEITRIKGKPREHFAARNQAKNEAGFLAK
jgi:hypothetical protein